MWDTLKRCVADIVVVDPEHLHEAMNRPEEAPMPAFGGLSRLVNRNPNAVPAVFIQGQRAIYEVNLLKALGTQSGFGRVLRATDRL